MKRIVLTLFLYLSLSYGKEPMDYGWNIPNTPIYVGGYIDVVYDENEQSSFLFDDISLLVSASNERFDFLSEVEISHLSLDGSSNNKDLQINVERLQVSYALNDEESLTVGRFNSDIGYWNQATVNILQETTTSPHMIEHLFPKATTGVMYKNSLTSEDSYSVMLQHNRDIGQKDESIVADRHVALSYHKDYDEFSWRLAGGFYREVNAVEARYAGMAFDYEYDDFSIQAEFFTQKSETGKSKPYSAYIQPVWYYSDKQSLVLRLERYKDEVLNANEAIMLLGYGYRPWSNVALKAEYIYHTKEPLDHFVYSVSVMF